MKKVLFEKAQKHWGNKKKSGLSWAGKSRQMVLAAIVNGGYWGVTAMDITEATKGPNSKWGITGMYLSHALHGLWRRGLIRLDRQRTKGGSSRVVYYCTHKALRVDTDALRAGLPLNPDGSRADSGGGVKGNGIFEDVKPRQTSKVEPFGAKKEAKAAPVDAKTALLALMKDMDREWKASGVVSMYEFQKQTGWIQRLAEATERFKAECPGQVLFD